HHGGRQVAAGRVPVDGDDPAVPPPQPSAGMANLADDIHDRGIRAEVIGGHGNRNAAGIGATRHVAEELPVEGLPVTAMDEQGDGRGVPARRRMEQVQLRAVALAIHKIKFAVGGFAPGGSVPLPAVDDLWVFRYPRPVVVLGLESHGRQIARPAGCCQGRHPPTVGWNFFARPPCVDRRRDEADNPSGLGTGGRRLRMTVLIIGGGIGGLALALYLHQRGIDCEVYERAREVQELGVGINTLPHAIKELAGLGLLEALDSVAVRTPELIYTNRFGQQIWREPRGLDAGYDYPQFS